MQRLGPRHLNVIRALFSKLCEVHPQPSYRPRIGSADYSDHRVLCGIIKLHEFDQQAA